VLKAPASLESSKKPWILLKAQKLQENSKALRNPLIFFPQSSLKPRKPFKPPHHL
jgi:hypothetical protein